MVPKTLAASSSRVFPALQFRQTSNDPVRLCFVHPGLLAAQPLAASPQNILLGDSKVKVLGPSVLVEMACQVFAEFVALGNSVASCRRFEPTRYQVQLHERGGYFGLIMVVHRDGVPRVEPTTLRAPRQRPSFRVAHPARAFAREHAGHSAENQPLRRLPALGAPLCEAGIVLSTEFSSLKEKASATSQGSINDAY
jgi:hypothetical protein